ncbi:hypothetical protein Sango_0263900 [Sesamum angolense]|uniref:Reverse transcriptase Ty1/copia-type domain-containing protein n=1 Tax=Sesamum angolense TaxID=2727404 RepID=A0AAE1XHK8_9LAMI|nr:hypothetical protein Sango_0263900 [Sesamum angolense]
MKEIYIDQLEGFTLLEKNKKPVASIFGLKQAFQSWNTRFHEIIWGYDFIKNEYDPCVYKKISGSSVAYLVLYVDDILLIRNDIKMLGALKHAVGSIQYVVQCTRPRSPMLKRESRYQDAPGGALECDQDHS